MHVLAGCSVDPHDQNHTTFAFECFELHCLLTTNMVAQVAPEERQARRAARALHFSNLMRPL